MNHYGSVRLSPISKFFMKWKYLFIDEYKLLKPNLSYDDLIYISTERGHISFLKNLYYSLKSNDLFIENKRGVPLWKASWHGHMYVFKK